MTRAENHARVKALRDLGLLHREIADRTGLSRSYVAELLADPAGDAARARKALYAGVCVDCQGPTSGSEGPSNVPQRCALCAARHQSENRKWTPGKVIAAIQWFDELFGAPPTTGDFCPSLIRRCSPGRIVQAKERAAAGGWPTIAVCAELFGSWNAALEAAGFEPARGARRARRRTTA